MLQQLFIFKIHNFEIKNSQTTTINYTIFIAFSYKYIYPIDYSCYNEMSFRQIFSSIASLHLTKLKIYK